MRWTESSSRDVKTKRKFALFPISINGETRWLEWVTIEYRYDYGWYKYRFTDQKKEEYLIGGGAANCGFRGAGKK